MKNTLKLVATGGMILAGSLAFTQSALAQTPTQCINVTSLSQWAAAGSCLQQDKLWTFGALGGVITDARTDFQFQPIGLTDFHRLLLDNFVSADTTVVDATTQNIIGTVANIVSYTIEIVDDPNTPENEEELKYFLSAAVDSDTLDTGNVVEKDGQGENTNTGDVGDAFTLVSTNGSKDIKNCATCEPNKISISAIRVAQVDGAIQTISDEYVQADRRAPEPATLALVGFGLVGAGFARIRRRKA